jgi:uncharacterized protein (TIGR02996 family)
VSEDEAFIRKVVDSPGDDLPRLVYADWLYERDDPRGAYLRAEVEWAKTKSGGPKSKSFAEKKRLESGLRRRAARLDDLWVARVSRTPIGVCIRNRIFAFTGPLVTSADIRTHESEIPDCPNEYQAFLLNYNGGLLTESRSDCEGFARLGTNELGHRYSETADAKISAPDSLPSLQGLASELCHPDISSNAWGGSSDPIFTDCIPIGFSRADFGAFHYFLLRPRKKAKKRIHEVIYYRNPCGSEWDGMDDDEADEYAAAFDEQDHVEVVASTFTDFLEQLDYPDRPKLFLPRPD